jgi:hypothetical protein
VHGINNSYPILQRTNSLIPLNAIPMLKLTLVESNPTLHSELGQKEVQPYPSIHPSIHLCINTSSSNIHPASNFPSNDLSTHGFKTTNKHPNSNNTPNSHTTPPRTPYSLPAYHPYTVPAAVHTSPARHNILLVGHSLAADIHKVPAVVVDIPSAVQQHSIRSFEGIALVVDSRFQLGERGSGSLIRIGAGCVLVLGIAFRSCLRRSHRSSRGVRRRERRTFGTF